MCNKLQLYVHTCTLTSNKYKSKIPHYGLSHYYSTFKPSSISYKYYQQLQLLDASLLALPDRTLTYNKVDFIF